MGQLRVQSRLYDAAANLTNIAYAVSPSIGIAYNAGSQRTAVTNTTGNYLNYAYDPTSQLKTAVPAISLESMFRPIGEKVINVAKPSTALGSKATIIQIANRRKLRITGQPRRLLCGQTGSDMS